MRMWATTTRTVATSDKYKHLAAVYADEK